MIKKLKYLLIIIPIILSINLILNIYKYNNTLKQNQDIIKNNNSYQEKTNKYNKDKEQLIIELNNLKEEKKEKIWEHERWIKWNQEIKEKIN